MVRTSSKCSASMRFLPTLLHAEETRSATVCVTERWLSMEWVADCIVLLYHKALSIPGLKAGFFRASLINVIIHLTS